MRDAARVMEAALEDALASLDEAFEIGLDEDEIGLAIGDAHARLSKALAEVRALPASNTETELDCKTCGCKYLALEQQNRAYWTDEAKAAEARLAQIAELVDDALPAEYAGNVYVDAEHYRSIQRLARGEEASE
jgi:hypothetical protein